MHLKFFLMSTIYASKQTRSSTENQNCNDKAPANVDIIITGKGKIHKPCRNIYIKYEKKKYINIGCPRCDAISSIYENPSIIATNWNDEQVQYEESRILNGKERLPRMKKTSYNKVREPNKKTTNSLLHAQYRKTDIHNSKIIRASRAFKNNASNPLNYDIQITRKEK